MKDGDYQNDSRFKWLTDIIKTKTDLCDFDMVLRRGLTQPCEVRVLSAAIGEKVAKQG